MASKQENQHLNDLTTKVAVMAEQLSTMRDVMTEMRGDIKGFSFVSEADYMKEQQIVDSRLRRLNDRVEALERNVSPMVKLKNAIGDRATQILVLIFFVLVIYGAVILLRHVSPGALVNGSEGGR